MSGAGSTEESGILQRHVQGCVEPSRGLDDPKFPLSTPNGVQLVEGKFYALRVDGVLGCSLTAWLRND